MVVNTVSDVVTHIYITNCFFLNSLALKRLLHRLLQKCPTHENIKNGPDSKELVPSAEHTESLHLRYLCADVGNRVTSQFKCMYFKR